MINMNQIKEILAELSISALKISPFKSFEDDTNYDIWLVETIDNKYVLKPEKNYEFEIYSTLFKEDTPGVPKLIASTEYQNKKFILIEYIEGKDLCRCEQSSLTLVLDALISLQEKYWDDQKQESIGYTYSKSYESRINRGKYLGDSDIEKAYDEFLSIYSKLPRTLCHDDLLPFNVIVNDKAASIIDWEYAGILPYATSIARLLAHTEDDKNAIFYMSEDDKEFAKQYYYDNLIAKHNISYDEYMHTLDLFLLYEYCEWIMLGNKYSTANKERAAAYTIKAKNHLVKLQKEYI